MKKDKKFYIALGIVMLVLLGLLILRVVLSSEKEDGVVLKDNVIIITEETSREHRPKKVGDNELVFIGNPNYKEGDVIVSGVTEEAPYGYIRSVIEIREINGEYYCHTKHATFLDVFEEAHIKETIEIMVNEDAIKQIGEPELLVSNSDYFGGMLASSLFKVQESKDNEDMDDLVSVEFEGNVDEDIYVEGAVGIKVWLDFSLDIENDELEWGMTANARTHGEMLFGFSSSKEDDFEKELLKIMPTIFTIWAGPVPIVVTNEMTCQLEGEYEITGDIGTQFKVDSTLNAGFIYTSKDNSVCEIIGKVMPSGGMEWDSSVGVEGKINGGVFVYLTTLLYDCSGAEVGIGMEGQAKGEARFGLNNGLQGELELAIYPQLKGNIIVEIPVLSEELFEVPLFEKSLEPLWSEKWTSVDEEEVATELEGIDHSGWRQLFSRIIEDTQLQIDADRIYFREAYFIEYPEEDGRGGVSAGFSGDIKEFKYYLDYTNGKEYPELLFIGAEMDGQMKILAIYSYYEDGNTAGAEASIDDFYCSSIGICTDNSIFCRDDWGDSYYNLEGESVQGSKDTLIDPDTIPWKPFDEWE